MATSIANIVTALESAGTTAGFVTIEKTFFNTKDNADTELPKLYIRLTSIDMSEQQYFSALETYNFDLIMVAQASTPDPISTLGTLYDNFLAAMHDIELFKMLARKRSIILQSADLTNDYETHERYGGESLILKMQIQNLKNYGGSQVWGS